MKKKYFFILSPLIAFVIYTTLSSSAGGVDNVYSPALGGCSCHGASTTSTVITLSGLPITGYQNGVTYPVTLTVSNPGITPVGSLGLRDGFDIKASAGTFTAITGTQLGGSTSELLHTTPKAAVGGTTSWTFNWNAPASGTATITFNAACNATNGDNAAGPPDAWNFFTTTLIKDPTPVLTLSATSTTILCNGGTSTITATATNGVLPYQYKLNAGTYQSSNVFAGNVAAIYTITVKDALNATATTTRNITQPTLITFAAGTVTNPLCAGGTGSISNTASGGTGTTKTYTITPLGPQSNTTGNFTGLTAQSYTITVSDANSCTKTKVVALTQPAALAFTTTVNNPLCNGGTGTISSPASGGIGTKTYSITPLGPQTNTTGNFTALTPQTYTITVTDGNNCTKTTVATITQPALLTIASPTITNALCNGGTGSATITPSGGVAPYTYTWNYTINTTVDLMASKDNSIFEQWVNNSNGAGPYTFAGKLANGFRNRAMMKFDLTSIPTNATITGTSLNLYCSNSAPGSGAQQMNLHKLSQDWGEGTSNSGTPGGQGIAATTNDATWLSRFFPGTAWAQPGGSFSNSISGSALVDAIGPYTWEDPGMMNDVQSWVSNPANNFGWLLKGVESAITQAKRFDSRETTIPGNEPKLTVSYTAVPSGPTQNNMPAGVYTVIVTDANNCTKSTTFTITEPAPTVVTAGNVSGCAGSPISLIGSPAGGTFSVADPYTGPSTTYTYTYTDGNGCSTTSDTASITVNSCGGSTVLNLTMFLEGYYSGLYTMLPVLANQGVGSSTTDVDSILVELKDPITYATVASAQAMLQTDGTASCNFGSAVGNYYIAVYHRNGLPTWSASPLSIIAGVNTYDFTSASSQAYGSNMKEVDTGVWAFYSGDLNADENVDLLDLGLVEVDINNFIFGYYATDINGDGNVDLLDVPIIESNLSNFIFAAHP